jgi:L-ascorbate metabolism protein UlaG (beta-lactamase superfamily)
MISDLLEIPRRFQSQGKNVDLMLIHLGGTSVPGPSMPLLMVTMDAKQGVEMLKLIGADVTIPIHFDDYTVFLSPLQDFIDAAKQAAFDEKRVVQLERGEEYKFTVRNERASDV